MDQKIISCNEDLEKVGLWLKQSGISKAMLVCGNNVSKLEIVQKFMRLPNHWGIEIIPFSDFAPNPDYESVVKGVEIFRNQGCDGLIAVGGGSAIDVAKCIKLFSNMDPGYCCLEQAIVPNKIPFLAVPTTAGTGSEATRFAVIYYQGVKQSISDYSCIPNAVIFDSRVLTYLPLYQKKATMFDALCHALESFWSVNSTDESKNYSKEAIRLIFSNMNGYLENSPEGNEGMLFAANIAGKAINITETTAGHAMCYKITSLFGTAHGHAAALCCRKLFPWMITHLDDCIDPRGRDYLVDTLKEIAKSFGCTSPDEGAIAFNDIFEQLDLEVPVATPAQLLELNRSVNIKRLRNHPIQLNEETIDRLYHEILMERTYEC